MAATSDAPGKDQSAGASAEERSASRFGRRSSKDVSKLPAKSKSELQMNLPSVPSTQNLHPL
ncbi:MAG: hypothetical protein Q9190_004756, partial [Brigantiaea leucoxantha]